MVQMETGSTVSHEIGSFSLTEWIKIFKEVPNTPFSFLKLNPQFNPTQCWPGAVRTSLPGSHLELPWGISTFKQMFC